jgi:GH15 family glucan-1,4-alpha-glucosidase
MTGAGTGTVAAVTTALPERASEGRSFDYRYVWIRDQCYIGQATALAGVEQLLDSSVAFVAGRLLEDGPGLMPAYRANGGAVPAERHVKLPGYPGGGDVIGNWVRNQFQLDAFGEAMLLFACAGDRDRLDADGWRAAEIAVEAVQAKWRQADLDAGIWELEPAAWTHSRLICAAGLRALAALPAAGERAGDWLALAYRIVADTAGRAIHPSGRWQRAPADERVDASLLLGAVRGALSAADPRSVATLHAVQDELTQDGYCYRYKPDERPLGEAEGAFLLCGFWLSLALRQQGDLIGAARWFERNRAACGPPGLLSEEYDVSQRQLRGNLPQAFVHAVLIEAAAALGQDGERGLHGARQDSDGARR